MSTIQLHSPDARPFIPFPKDDAPAIPAGSRKPHSDGGMMYAWSIGVTPAARTMANDHRATKRRDAESDACPPEVYIG